MTYQQAVAYFGSQTKMAVALGITQPSAAAWRHKVPARWQYALEVLTDGKLRADPELRQLKQARR